MSMDYPEPLPAVICGRCGRKGYDLGGGFGTKPGDPCDAPINEAQGRYCLGLFTLATSNEEGTCTPK